MSRPFLFRLSVGVICRIVEHEAPNLTFADDKLFDFDASSPVRRAIAWKDDADRFLVKTLRYYMNALSIGHDVTVADQLHDAIGADDLQYEFSLEGCDINPLDKKDFLVQVNQLYQGFPTDAPQPAIGMSLLFGKCQAMRLFVQMVTGERAGAARSMSTVAEPAPSPMRRGLIDLTNSNEDLDNAVPADVVKDQPAVPSGVSERLSVKKFTRAELRELEDAKKKDKDNTQKEITLECTNKRCVFFNRQRISEDHPMSGLVESKLVYKVDPHDRATQVYAWCLRTTIQ